MGCTDLLRRGIGAPHQCPLKSAASFLCYFMLTFAHFDDSSHFCQGDMSRIVVVAIAEGFGALQSIMFQEPVEVRAGLKRFGLKLFAPLAAKLGQ